MEIPEEEIVALLEYVESDLELGIQVNIEEWERTTKNVREWLSGLTKRVPDVCPACHGDRVVFDGVLRQCPSCNGTGNRR